MSLNYRHLKTIRIPVLEAFKVLETQEYLSHIPRGGLALSGHSDIKMRNLYKIHKAFEIMALESSWGKAMLEVNLEQVHQINNGIIKPAKKQRIKKYLKLNHYLNTQLASIQGNQRLLPPLETIYSQFSGLRPSNLHNVSTN